MFPHLQKCPYVLVVACVFLYISFAEVGAIPLFTFLTERVPFPCFVSPFRGEGGSLGVFLLSRGGAISLSCMFLIPRGGASSLGFFLLYRWGSNCGGFFLYRMGTIRHFLPLFSNSTSVRLFPSFSPFSLVFPFGDLTRKKYGLKLREDRGTHPFLLS